MLPVIIVVLAGALLVSTAVNVALVWTVLRKLIAARAKYQLRA